MRNWGVGFLICGALAIVGLFSEPQEDFKEGLFGTGVFIVGGGLLFNKGQKYLNTMKEVAEEALKQIRENDYIDTLALSKKFQISEIEIRQMISKSQNKKFIPFGILIK
tara:strand:+ start:1041 stop:1367 length:327 start_codon:yes stop_codon:yes gene_type:complete